MNTTAHTLIVMAGILVLFIGLLSTLTVSKPKE
jgi:hypothetical protein